MILEDACTIVSLRNNDPLEQFHYYISKIFPDRPLIVPRDGFTSNDSAKIDPGCLPTTTA